MNRTLKPTMEESIKALPFTTRLRNACLAYGKDRCYLPNPLTKETVNFEDLVIDYHKDPRYFEMRFLRIPNTGEKTYNELKSFLDTTHRNGNYPGRMVAVTQVEAQEARDALDEVCNSVGSGPIYDTLRSIQWLLTAGTVCIEQPQDERDIFNREAP